MTTLDRTAADTAWTACLLAVVHSDSITRKAFEAGLAAYLDAISSIPEQGATWKPITDHTPPDDQYWQMAVDVIERAGKGFHHAVLTNHHAATLLYWANLARDAALAPSQPAAVAVTDEMVERACKAHAPQWSGIDDEINPEFNKAMKLDKAKGSS